MNLISFQATRQVPTVYSPTLQSSLSVLIQTAKTQAIAGAAAGLAYGAVQSIISVRRNQLRDGYDVATEGLAHVSTGAILGCLAAMAASVAGVSVAAIAGRGILSVAAPTVASAIVTSGGYARVDRVVRPWSEGVVNSLKRTMQGEGAPKPVPTLSGP